MHLHLISRQDAIAHGLSTYFTGKPCKRGHVDLRSTKYKICLACNRAKVAQWVSKNVDRKRAADTEYRKLNKDKVAKNKRDHYMRNAEKIKARTKQWSIDNRERAQQNWNAATRAYRARQRAASGKHTAADVANLLASQRNRCACCGVKLTTYHVDHIVPLYVGGSNDKGNLQILCPACNASKAAKDPITFMQERGFLI